METDSDEEAATALAYVRAIRKRRRRRGMNGAGRKRRYTRQLLRRLSRHTLASVLREDGLHLRSLEEFMEAHNVRDSPRLLSLVGIKDSMLSGTLRFTAKQIQYLYQQLEPVLRTADKEKCRVLSPLSEIMLFLDHVTQGECRRILPLRVL